MTDPYVPIAELLPAEEGEVPPTHASFLEASRRYLFEVVLPAGQEPGWSLAREPRRPWISSRAARRSRAWPAASGLWDRR
jgi:hypothetical protein